MQKSQTKVGFPPVHDRARYPGTKVADKSRFLYGSVPNLERKFTIYFFFSKIYYINLVFINLSTQKNVRPYIFLYGRTKKMYGRTKKVYGRTKNVVMSSFVRPYIFLCTAVHVCSYFEFFSP